MTAAGRAFEAALIGMLVSGFLALAATGELHAVTLAAAGAGFAARIVMLLWEKPVRAAAWAVNAAVILYAGFYPLDVMYVGEDFLQATVRLICFLTVVKGLTFANDRDAMYAVLISFAEILAAALLSSNLLFFVFLSLFLFCCVLAFSAWEIVKGSRHARMAAGTGRGFGRRLVTVSAITSLGILAFTVMLFFVLPRTARAALQNLVSQRFHLPGFGGEVDLRKIGEIQQSTRTILYIKMAGEGSVLPYKWRGSAMSRFDGNKWMTSGDLAEQVRVRNGATALPFFRHPGRTGRRVRYEVQLGETGMNALFIAGLPEFVEIPVGSLAVLSNGSIRTLGDAPAVLRYSVTAFFDARGGDGTQELTREERRLLVELPLRFNPAIAALAQEVGGTENNVMLVARRIEEYLRSRYGYTLELPETQPEDPIANFLFERRRGHCEYFASAMALMLRSVGIPSRVVTGFQGGEYNPVSEWYTVRASDAHSWVEAFVPGNGWTAFDPTPAAPRTEQFAAWARVGQLVEAADLFWQEWVMQYDLERQFRLAEQLERTRWGTRGLLRPGLGDSVDNLRDAGKEWVKKYWIWATVLGVLLGLGFATGPAAWKAWQLRERRQRMRRGAADAHDAAILYGQMLLLLEKRGVRKPAWFTAAEFARKMPAGREREQVTRFTDAYERVRFGGETAAAGEMISIYEELAEKK